MNLIELTESIIKSIVKDKESVAVKEFPSEDENTIDIEVLVSEDDLGRVIGKMVRLRMLLECWFKQAVV